MKCQKCSGLMVADYFYDHQLGDRCLMQRCVNCGLAFDEVSLANRANPPSVREKYCKVREVGVRI